MKPRWYFNPRRNCDRMRDSANDAFFTAESLENLSEALVRESIQNSLDAARREADGTRQVIVSIKYEPKATDLVRKYLSSNFSSARQNFEQGIGLKDISAIFGTDCGYIAIEDFGTKGLTGDINNCCLQQPKQNAFISVPQPLKKKAGMWRRNLPFGRDENQT